MNKILTNIKLFTVIGVSLTLLGYFFIVYNGYILNNDNIQLEIQKQNLIEEIKTLEKVKEKAFKIMSSSEDNTTKKEAKELIKETGEPINNYFTSNNKKNSESAENLEKEGFRYLIDKNVILAIEAFTKSENTYNGYHNVYAIARYLSKNKDNLIDRNSQYWKIVYRKILEEYSWKMPEDSKALLEELVK